MIDKTLTASSLKPASRAPLASKSSEGHQPVSEGGKSAVTGGVAESVSSKVYSSVKTEMSSLWSKGPGGSESEDGMAWS
jgi:hypothetical protein